jgi:hypothetical protein
MDIGGVWAVDEVATTPSVGGLLCAGVGACKGSIMMLDFPCPQTPRVSVVIVAKSKLDLLRACLQSVARFAPGAIPFETIVVLNEAGADAEAELRAMATGVKGGALARQPRFCRRRKPGPIPGARRIPASPPR